MRLGVVAIGLLIILAGCLGKPSNNNVQSAATNATNITDVPQGRGPVVAFEETNQTEQTGIGSVNHHHDYWGSNTRVTLFDMQTMITPPVAPDGGPVSVTFSVPQGKFVYEGTSSVEFTISEPTRHVCEGAITFGSHYYCSDYLGSNPAGPPVPDPTGGPSGLKLQYKHASAANWIDAGELKWGSPTIIKINQAIETDMPHATSSVWRFMITSPSAQDQTLEFKAKAEIVKGEGAIPLWPPHPLFYTAEKPTRTVLDNATAESCGSGFGNLGCAAAGKDAVRPDANGPYIVPTKLISYGTKSLWVYVNVSSATFPNPADAPVAWFLYHYNATGAMNITNPFDYKNASIDKKTLLWVLPVDDGSMDSPYADASRWGFSLGASFTTPDASPVHQSCYGGCAEWDAKYSIVAIASSAEPPGDQVHLYCLDPNTYCGK